MYRKDQVTVKILWACESEKSQVELCRDDWRKGKFLSTSAREGECCRFFEINNGTPYREIATGLLAKGPQDDGGGGAGKMGIKAFYPFNFIGFFFLHLLCYHQ
jgi:hypothetical protein